MENGAYNPLEPIGSRTVPTLAGDDKVISRNKALHNMIKAHLLKHWTRAITAGFGAQLTAQLVNITVFKPLMLSYPLPRTADLNLVWFLRCSRQVST